jgi:hypothetical protein
VQPGRDPRMCLGGSCMAFCPPGSEHEEAGLLLVGTEGGQLLRCQVGADAVASNNNALSLSLQGM